MQKIIKILLILLFMTVISTVRLDAAQKSFNFNVLAYNQDDLRVKALENVFAKHHSPLTPFAKDYVSKADEYEMDWRLLPSIAGLESSFGNAQLKNSYNSYGWGGGKIYFNSVEDGIDTVLFGLKNRYLARGASTVETIAPIYSESPTWAPRVRHFMNEIEAEYEKLGLTSLTLTI